MRKVHPRVPQAVPSSSMAASTTNQPTKPTRRRTPKTCGECRRLKLKCDRVFPCQSCVKRGCEGICPEGSLVSGRGSRYILANTEQLHEKIVHMAERIRDLEEALGAISEEHARCLSPDLPPSGPVHPLLREDLLLIKNQLELYGPDRSQLTTRSDVSHTSDCSDGEQSRLGSEQSLSPSPLEVFLLGYQNTPTQSGGTTQLLDHEFSQYTAGGNASPASHMISNLPLTAAPWSGNFHGSNAYQTEIQAANGGNGVAHPSYASAASTVSVGDYQHRNYQPSGASLSLQHSMGANAPHHSDGTRYLSSSVLTHNESDLVEHLCSMWDLDGRPVQI